MNLVVDANVALKWFVAENDTAAALAVRTAHNLVAPDLLLIECRNALLNKVRRRELSIADAHQVEREFDTFGIVVLPAAEFLSQAFALAIELGEPIYDCIYLAMAIATDYMLLTADNKFADTVRRSSLGQDRVMMLADITTGP